MRICEGYYLLIEFGTMEDQELLPEGDEWITSAQVLRGSETEYEVALGEILSPHWSYLSDIPNEG